MRLPSLPIFALLALAMTTAYAQFPQFDTSFGINGELENPLPSLPGIDGDREFKAAAYDHEGRIVIGGDDVESGFYPVARVGRLLPSGLADASYGSAGVATLSRAAVNGMRVNDILVLPDGSALVCGTAELSNRKAGFVARLDINGQQDVMWAPGSFDGVVLMGHPDVQNSDCNAVEQLGDGRIVLGGSADIDGFAGRARYGYLVMLDERGYYDPRFQGDGYLVFPSIQNLVLKTVFAISEQPGFGLLVELGELDTSRQTNTLRVGYDGNIDTGFIPAVEFQSGPFNGFSAPIGSELLWPLPGGNFRTGMPRHDQGTGYLPELLWADWPTNGGNSPLTQQSITAVGAGGRLSFGGGALGPDGRVLMLSQSLRQPGTCQVDNAYLNITRRLHDGNADTGFAANGQFEWFPSASFNSRCDNGVEAGRDIALNRAGRILAISSIAQGYPNTSSTTTRLRPLLTQFVGNAFSASPWDIQANAISFNAGSARPNSRAESDFVQVTGLGSGVNVPAYPINGDLRIGFGTWSSAPRWVKNGDWLQVRGTAPASDGGSSIVQLYVGGIRGHNTWSSLGDRVRADFQINANQPPLDGTRCSSSGINGNCSAAIPDQGSVSSMINLINGGSCNYINSVRVGIDLSHSYLGDLRVTLTDPNGQVFIGGSEGIVSLLNRPQSPANSSAGSCDENNVLAMFDDTAGLPAHTSCGIPVIDPALSGERQPFTALSQLAGRRTTGNNGASSNGIWTLTIEDLAGGDSGQLNDWTLDLDCTASPPAIADLGVTVSGSVPVGGDTMNLTWTVTNNGPVATSNGRFRSSLPTGLTDRLDNPGWACVTSAGGSCSAPAWCSGVCLGSEIDVGLSLPVGGTATVFATGTLTELASSGNFVVNGQVTSPIAIGGTRDNNPGNNDVQFSQPITRVTDMAVLAMNHSWNGQTVSINTSFNDLGPSIADGASAQIDLPDGLTVTNFGCQRGGTACAGSLQLLAGNLLRLDSTSLLPNRAPIILAVTASWPGSTSPGQVAAMIDQDIAASDPDLNNNLFNFILTAPVPSDRIFANGFD
ncbi:hypothetical protein [Dokdonella sp.]|uniref:hypothetical protein n=1 Tax=Dokdonella sp. TaxID=2291710 RepID=UPI0035290E38